MPTSHRLPRTGLAVLALSLLLAGCATLNEQECRGADWRAIGRSDGQQGRALERLDEHRKACAEHGVTPNADRYWLGRSEGLQSYCQLDNALRLGRAGQAYLGVCPPHIDPAFRRFHAATYEVWRLRSSIDSVDNDIEQHERSLRQTNLSDRDRTRLRQAIRELDRRRDRLRDDLLDQERRVDRLVQDTRPGPLPR